MTQPTTATGEEFARFLAEFPRGRLPLDLSAAMAECVTATQLTGKVSRFTLTVTMRPTKGIDGELEVTSEVSTKPAKGDVPSLVFYPTNTGGLSRRDPNQPTLPGVDA